MHQNTMPFSTSQPALKRLSSREQSARSRCTARRAAREARERGAFPAPSSLEAPLYRPLALLALIASLGVATPLGAIALYRLYASADPVPGVWISLHAHLQIFGFAGLLIMGIAPHLLLRFRHAPIERPKVLPWIVGLAVLGVGTRLGAAALAGSSVAFPWIVAEVAELSAYVIFAAWVTAGNRAAAPRFVSDWLLVTGAWWFVAALALEAGGIWRAVATGLPPATAIPGPGLYAMGLYGGIFGWVLGVAMRVAPMFFAERRVSALSGLVPFSLNGGVFLSLLAEAWDPAARTHQALSALGELGVAAALVLGALAVGAWRPESRRALRLFGDRAETRFFRLAFSCAGLGAAGLLVGAISDLAGSPVPGLLADATRHLLTVGFLVGMVLAMGFRFLPVIEGVRLSLPWIRQAVFSCLGLSVLLRTGELLAGYSRGVLPLAAISGFLAWIALAAWGLAVLLTMVQGAALRRRPPRRIPSQPQAASDAPLPPIHLHGKV